MPVKAFHAAKLRLAPALGPAARAALVRSMATRVVEAAGNIPVAVVCDDGEVAEWATSVSAQVIWCPGRGLNAAVADGVAALAAAGHQQVIVAHADLPHALDLTWMVGLEGVTIVPDRHEDGTNVVSVPAAAGFCFAYGPGSFARHRAEATRLGITLRVVREPRLGWDVDNPEDLRPPAWNA